MLKGSYAALVTPFKNNKIDYNALEGLLDFHMENGTDGLVLCGTTAEAPALAGDEKESLVRYVMQRVQGRLKIGIGTGSNNLQHTIAATLRAQNQKADFAMVITPYYNKPTQNGLYHYFKAVSEAVEIPFIIYNVPGRTGVNIQAETTLKLANECANIVGIKEASGDLVQITTITRDAPEGFCVMSGEDALNLPSISCGASGAISVTANAAPGECSNLIKNANKGNYKEATAQHKGLLELNNAMFLETNPIPVKTALYLMGKIELEFRLPMCKMTEENAAKLKDVLTKYKMI